MRVGFFGGSFDPPHAGHQMAMAYVLGCARVERLLMVPCFQHPFDKRLSPFPHRLAMCRAVAEPFGARVEVSDVEARMGGASRTLRTVKALRAEHPGDDLVLVIGSDLLAERERWYGYPELVTLVEFFVVGRAGHPAHVEGRVVVDIPDVSSTEIRARVRAAQPIDGMVPSAVADYVAAERLYLDRYVASHTSGSQGQPMQLVTVLESFNIQGDELDRLIAQAVFNEFQQSDVGLVPGGNPIGQAKIEVVEALQQRIGIHFGNALTGLKRFRHCVVANRADAKMHRFEQIRIH